MSVNLLRNSKVFFTTHVDLDDPNRGRIKPAGHTKDTTFEIQVLDDLSFNQTTAVETIAVNEAGTTPIRGQRQFNTALNPVDFNFSTYLRPAKVGTIGGTVTQIRAVTTIGYSSVAGSTPVLNFAPWDTVVDTWDSTKQATYNAFDGLAPNQAISASFGPNTTVEVALQDPNGKPLILAPIFGTAPTKLVGSVTVANDTYNRLIGFRIVDGGEGYVANATTPIVVDVFDPDSGAETEQISVYIDQVSMAGSGYRATCEEAVLWNAMFSPDQPVTNATSFTNKVNGAKGAFQEVSTYTSGHPATVTLEHSNSHQLQRFGMIVIFDQNTFLLDDCSLTQASIDFGIDQIATIQWSGQARAIRRVVSPTLDYKVVGGKVPSGGIGDFTSPIGAPPGSDTIAGSFRIKITEAPFIANKLSTVTLSEDIGGFGSAHTWAFTGSASGSAKSYTIPLTAGNITLQNNITYLTPAYMGAVNQAVTYFTGSRNITGSLTAYLRSGSGVGTSAANNYTANLFSDLVTKVNTDSDPQFALQIEIGGKTNPTKVELAMPAVVLTIPTINAESVITSAINFTAQSSDQTTKLFDIIKDNEIMIKYFV